MNKNATKLVLIVGAGSSCDFGLPLANQIFTKADEVLGWKRGASNDSLRIAVEETEQNIRYIYANLPKDKSLYPSFEEVLTYIWNDGNLGLGKFNYDVFNNFVTLLGLTIAGSMGLGAFAAEYQFGTRLALYEKFIKSLINQYSKVVFISLNYDILLDNTLSNLSRGGQRWLDYGIPYRGMKSRHINRAGSGLILKPHGSINLAYCDRCRNFFCNEDNLFTPIANKRKWAECPVCLEEKDRNVLMPLILPPIYNKDQFLSRRQKASSLGERIRRRIINLVAGTVSHPVKNYYDDVTAAILSHLKGVDTILAIGYSMPGYDYSFKQLLLRGLQSNPNRNNVKIELITNTDGDAREEKHLLSRYEYLGARPTIKWNKGFYNFIAQNS